ncbi:MAG: hypothetical protein LBJ02_08330 [Bifidobacteriaceae bacterium]|nr:hypothetical protein [Bifidobacteriaceae bacterium]
MSGVIFDGSTRQEFQSGEGSSSPDLGDYLSVIDHMARSRAVVIPLRDSGILSGLTEAAGAIALNKPLIATRGTGFPLALTPESGGVLVDDASAEAWGEAILSARAGRLVGAGSLAPPAEYSSVQERR